MRASVLDLLDDFERWHGTCAYVFPRGYRHERWSYHRVATLAFQFARELEARAITKGDTVLLWTPNCAEWVAAFFGCALCGVVVVPIDDAASPDFAQRICAQVRPKLVLCASNRSPLFENVATIDPVNLSAETANHSPERFHPCGINPEDPLEIVFTSGTTAEPKGVVLTHANVVGNLVPIENEIRKYLKYERLVHPLRFLNLLPLSHVFGQFLGIFIPPLLGGTVIFSDTFNPTQVMATIRRERVSVLVAVPRMLEALKQKIERDAEVDSLLSCGAASPRQEDTEPGRMPPAVISRLTEHLSAARDQHFLRRWWTFRAIRREFGWKFWALICGGAALDHDTEEFWHRLGYAVVQGYGLTETTSLISLNHPFHTSRGSIGKVLPGRELKLADDGEILVRGSGVASNYWTGHQLHPVAQLENQGWYRTGDLGALDQEGNLFFKGRKKEVIVTSAGMNIYPDDLETALRKQKDVRDCVVVGLERGGNSEPCAVLILGAHDSASSPAIAQRVLQGANEILAGYQRMRTWFVWLEPDFPRGSTQKPRRNVIRETVENALRRQVPDKDSPLAELVSRITGRAFRNFTSTSNLENGLGLSSLERVELFGALEDRYQIDLGDANLAHATTIGDLEKLLSASSDARYLANQPGSRKFHYPKWTLRWPATWLRFVSQYLLSLPTTFLLAWPTVTGRANLRGLRGPLLIISNHITDVDIGFIQAALPPRIRHRVATATAGETLERLHSPGPDRYWIGRIFDRAQWVLAVTLLNLFPLPRLAGFRKSFVYAGEAVDRGYSILVFPEGKYTEDGRITSFRSGIGLLANNLRIPILPMRIDGLFEIKKSGKKFAPPGRIQIRIGELMRFDSAMDPEEIARVLQTAVEKL